MNEYLRHLNRIEFVITEACTGRCIHCQNGDNLDRTRHIASDVATDAIAKISALYDIKSVMTFGGEPLLYPDTVCAIHAAAKEAHIPKRQLITNGYFTKSTARAAEIAVILAETGVNDLLVSVDAFHQETIPLDTVLDFVRAAANTNIPVTLSPAWLVSKSDVNPFNIRTKEILEAFSGMDNVTEGSGNIIFPAGNALKYLRLYFDSDETPIDPYVEDPYDLHSISFSSNGDVLGSNVYEADIVEIIEKYDPAHDNL